MYLYALEVMPAKAEQMDIKFGYSCNNNCIHCVIAGHRERLIKSGKPIDRSTSELHDMLSDAKERKIRGVVFTGGEVTIRKDFFDLLRFARDLGLRVGLQTNGRSFCSSDFARRTLEIAPDLDFEIAVHSDLAEIHDEITRTFGSYAQTLRGIQNLICRGSNKVNLKLVISRLNFQRLPQMVALAKHLGARQLDISFPHGLGNAQLYWNTIVPRYSEIKPYLNKSAEEAVRQEFKVSYEAIPFCILPDHLQFISEISYLRQNVLGETSLLEQVDDPELDWNKSRLAIKAKTENCFKCRFFRVCEGVWAEYVECYGSKELEPVKGKLVQSLSELG
jgi:MoaA/NifB/PqqE/SkfB family radical SAM enzyme